MARRGISEPNMVVENALPPTADAEVIKRAKLEQIEPCERNPFEILWQYDCGRNREILSLKPGDKKTLRASDAQALFKQHGEEGIAVYPDNATPKVITKARREALQRARQFYRARGQVRITEFRKKQGFDDRQVEDERYGLLWVFHYNQALSEILNEHLAAAPKAAA
jgi:hypothetical protein